MSSDVIAVARAMATEEIVPTRCRAKKTVLVLFSGAAAQDSKVLEYAKAFLLEDDDDVFVAHFVRGVTWTVYGPERVAGSVATDEDAVRSRPGVRVVALARDDAGVEATTPATDWLPEHARAELLDRRISHPKTLVRCLQIDSMSGKFSVEEALEVS